MTIPNAFQCINVYDCPRYFELKCRSRRNYIFFPGSGIELPLVISGVI